MNVRLVCFTPVDRCSLCFFGLTQQVKLSTASHPDCFHQAFFFPRSEHIMSSSSRDQDLYDIIFARGVLLKFRFFYKLQSCTLTNCLGGAPARVTACCIAEATFLEDPGKFLMETTFVVYLFISLRLWRLVDTLKIALMMYRRSRTALALLSCSPQLYDDKLIPGKYV